MRITQKQQRTGFTLVELLVVISIIALLAGISTPAVMKVQGNAERIKGISNAKSIKTALDLFAGEFDGEYPSDDTAEEIFDIQDDNVGSRSGGGSRLSGGNLEGGSRLSGERPRNSRGSATKPSNFYFQQLIGTGLDNEDIFTMKAFKKAFRVSKSNTDKQIEQGENVWAYTKNLQQTSSSYLPLVFDSPISTGDSPKFSKKVWGGITIVARLDSSVEKIKITGSDKLSGPVRGKVDGERVNMFAPESLEEGVLCPADLKLTGANN